MPLMPPRPSGSDPRKPGGDISGPGGPFDMDSVVIDATDAVLLDQMTAAAVIRMADGVPEEKPTATLMLEGKINKTDERSKVLYMMSLDGAAALVAEVVGLIGRLPDQESREEFTGALAEAFEKMPGLGGQDG